MTSTRFPIDSLRPPPHRPHLDSLEGAVYELAFIPHVGWLAHEPCEELIGLLRQGYFEAAEQAFLWLYLRPGDRIIDCGAHIGLYSLLAQAATGGDCHLTCVEANPRTARLLSGNLEACGARDARVVEAAVWSRAGRLAFIAETEGRSAYARLAFGEPGAELEVQATTLDELVESGGPAQVALVKLDLEGAEPEAFEGAARVIASGQCPLFMVEFTEANLERRGWTSQRLVGQLAELGLMLCDFDSQRRQLVPFNSDQPIWFRNLFAARDPAAVNARLQSATPAALTVAQDILGRASACQRLQELEELSRLKSLVESNESWARNVEANLAVEKALSSELRVWAEQAEASKTAEVEAARALARENEAWARDVETKLSAEKALSSELRAWAEQAEASKAAEVAAARALARENEAWALRTEALLAEGGGAPHAVRGSHLEW